VVQLLPKQKIYVSDEFVCGALCMDLSGEIKHSSVKRLSTCSSTEVILQHLDVRVIEFKPCTKLLYM
jgi:hypothetical protein